MKKSTHHVKQHKKAHHQNVRRPQKALSKRGAHSGHVLQKRKNKKLNHFPTAVTTVLASAVVGAGLLSLLVARTGFDTIKKTIASFY